MIKYILGLLFCFICFYGPCQSIDSLALAEFKDATVELQNSELMRNGSVCIQIKRVASKEHIFSMNGQLSVPAASTMKLITTSSALAILGPDFRFTTYLEYSGTIAADTLFGNIYVRGTGDPSLGSARFDDQLTYDGLIENWVMKIKGLGILHIQGQIIADDRYFEGAAIPDSWIWGDIGNAYGVGAFGLNLNENYYTAKFVPGLRAGDSVRFVTTEPVLNYLIFDNRLTTGLRGSGDRSLFYTDPLGEKVQFIGNIPAGPKLFSVKGAIPNPSIFVQNALFEALIANNVSVENIDPGTQTVKKEVAKYVSPTLSELCRQTNLWSINLYADVLFRKIGKELTGKADYESSAMAIKNYWQQKGGAMGGFMAKDGSGLSPSGSFTMDNLTEVLCLIEKDKVFNQFYDGLAVLGESGTVRRLARNTKAANNIRAKSGSIEGVRAFGGYVTTKSGALLAFGFVAHKYQPKSEKLIVDELEKLMILLADL